MSEKGAAAPIPWKKYQTYDCKVDPDQDDRSSEIKMFSFARPHMRAFHTAWMGFFMAFFIWFAISPLLSEMRATLALTKQEIWTSSVVAVAGTIFMRLLVGPLCDKFGSRILFAAALIFASFPTACVGLTNSAGDLAIIRLFIGVVGSTFVMTQFWTTRMFTKSVVGTANAVVGGWGNLGGGVTQLVVGSFLFPMLKNFWSDDELKEEKAWRTVCVIPAICTLSLAIFMVFYTEDAPKGNYWEMKRQGVMPEVSAAVSFRDGALNLNTWILFVQYAGCFGVELTMNNAAALYFTDEFGQSTESAAAIASLFGWMNLFARGLGGFFSDICNGYMGMRGRIAIQTFFLVGEGIMVLVFANSKTLGLAIFYLVIFSLFVQAAEGSSFGIVPYIDPPATGSISGIVGAGGNVGAVSFSMCFRELEYKQAFYIMGFTILATGACSLFIYIKGCSALLYGTDTVIYGAQPADKTLTVPEPETSATVAPMKRSTKAIPVKDYDSDYDAEEVEA